jgi:hypothetical protein
MWVSTLLLHQTSLVQLPAHSQVAARLAHSRAQAPAPRSPARITGWGGRGFAAVLMFKMFFTSPLTCLVTVQDTSSAQPCPRNLVSCCLPPFLHWMRECSYFFPQRSVQGNRGECFRFRKTLQKKKKKYFLKILLVLLDWC